MLKSTLCVFFNEPEPDYYYNHGNNIWDKRGIPQKFLKPQVIKKCYILRRVYRVTLDLRGKGA